MLGSVIAWLKGLSFIGKTAVGVVTVGSVTALAQTAQPPAAPIQQSDDATDSKVQTISQPLVVTKEIVETEVIPFQKTTENASWIEQGKTSLKQAGSNGEKNYVYEVSYKDGVENGRELVSENITIEPTTEVTYVGTYVKPAPRSVAPDCDPNYSGGCVPNVGYDLDCADIRFTVRVIGYDKHGFDRDRDGYGCESY